MTTVETTPSAEIQFPVVEIGDWIIYEGKVMVKTSPEEALDILGRIFRRPGDVKVKVLKTVAVRI